MEKNQLESITATSKGIAGAQAKSILEAVYQEEYTNCPTVDGGAGYKHSSGWASDRFTKLYGLTIDVKPNPATIWAAFEYTLPSEESQARIIISDVKGNTIDIINVSGKQGQKLWDTRNISAGIYVYTLEYAGAKESGKLIISR